MKTPAAWSTVLAGLSIGASLLPRAIFAAAAHDATPGAALGYVLIGMSAVTVAFLAPLVLAPIWLVGYRAWLARPQQAVIRQRWSTGRVLLWLGLAFLTAEVFALSATAGVLPGFGH